MIVETAWSDYPRPQLKRESFFSLNGDWSFAVSGDGKEPDTYTESIRVPYPVESKLSGIGRRYPKQSVYLYHRRFTLPEGFLRERVIFHCGGIDQRAELLINGKSLGCFITAVEGPVCCDITAVLVQGENEILLKVKDDLEKKIPYGKQRENNGGMWYTPFSGIWQTPWLESVPEKYIKGIRITPSTEKAVIDIIGEGVEEGVLFLEGREYPYDNGHVEVIPEEIRLWTPEFPYLYYFSIRSGEDEVYSYFALRSLEIREAGGRARLCLNGKPYFFHGLLDQGYYPDGICTPKNSSAYKWDILASKRMGFNTLRKHIKVEPEEFYYECDRIGMIVFQDMVNNGQYSFLRDTLLPNLGLIKKDDAKSSPDPETGGMFLQAMESEVKRLYSHPCICLWTIFNEGWGQFDSGKAYGKLRSLDSTRFIDSTSGWFETGTSDVKSIHCYFRKFRMPEKEKKPVLLSEFGGYAMKPEGHYYGSEKTYGYRSYRDAVKYMEGLEHLYLEEILPAAEQGLCGAVYTQITDVEDEVNGLMSYDRQVVKPDEEKMRTIAGMLKKASEKASEQATGNAVGKETEKEYSSAGAVRKK